MLLDFLLFSLTLRKEKWKDSTKAHSDIIQLIEYTNKILSSKNLNLNIKDSPCDDSSLQVFTLNDVKRWEI